MAASNPGNPGTRIVAKVVFPVVDLGPATAFYRSLGFTVESYDEGYAWVTNGGEEVVHLAAVEDLDPVANRAAGYFHVQDVEAWYEAWRAAGIDVDPIEDRPWGMREFSLHDPSGNLVRVGQNL